MRTVPFIALALITLLGCHDRRPYLTKGTRPVIYLEDKGHPTPCHVTNYEELRPLKESQHFTYIGTKDGHHIIYWWTKIAPAPDAVLCYAVPQEQFTPDHPFEYVAWGNWNKHPNSPVFK